MWQTKKQMALAPLHAYYVVPGYDTEKYVVARNQVGRNDLKLVPQSCFSLRTLHDAFPGDIVIDAEACATLTGAQVKGLKELVDDGRHNIKYGVGFLNQTFELRKYDPRTYERPEFYSGVYKHHPDVVLVSTPAGMSPLGRMLHEKLERAACEPKWQNFGNDRRVIDDKFYMIQSDVVNPESKNDKFGRATFEWPGRSIFGSKQEALEGAQALAEKNPERTFYVMEAVAAVKVKAPKVKFDIKELKKGK